VTVLRIPRDALEENFSADPGFSMRFYRALGMLLSHRLRTTSEAETAARSKIRQARSALNAVCGLTRRVTPERPLLMS
jgi:CRP-like cAMP-binding protein